MRSRSPLSIAVACMILLVGATAALCQPSDPASRFPPSHDYQPAAGVGFRVVSIISDGTRLHGELFWPRAEDGHPLPTVVMAHGWGGVAAALRHDASDIAQAGYLVLLFDYRGWGESDARVVLTGPAPVGDAPFTAEVRPLRGYIDPFEQVEDWFNAIDWLAGEPMDGIEPLPIRRANGSNPHPV